MIFNKTANICRMFERKPIDPLVALMVSNLYKSFEITKCPFPKGTKFIAENYTLDADKLPRFIPSTPYLNIVEFFIYEKLEKIRFCRLKFEGTIVNLKPLLLKNAFNPSAMLG